MIYSIKLSSKAEKYFAKLDKSLKKRIADALKEIACLPNPVLSSTVKPLTGDLKGFYRIRVGDYRTVFSIIEEKKIIAVVNIAPRGNVYK